MVQRYKAPDIERDRRVLELLSQNFPNISSASTEIINLEAILNLPKATETSTASTRRSDTYSATPQAT